MSVIAIDWSGAKHLARQLCLAEVADGELRRLETLSSRDEAFEHVMDHVRRDARAIFGLDFAFSFPAWFLQERGLSTAFDLWALAVTDGERWLRECASPFWGRPHKCRPDLPSHFRRTEEDAQRKGHRAKSCFQIGGAGAVGTGSIRGLPFLKKIREAGIFVWPFDAPGLPMVVEIYPRVLTGPVNKSSREARLSHFERCWPSISPTTRELAARSEDAFDATISALVMDRCRAELDRLPAIDDDVLELEGIIWTPASDERL